MPGACGGGGERRSWENNIEDGGIIWPRTRVRIPNRRSKLTYRMVPIKRIKS